MLRCSRGYVRSRGLAWCLPVAILGVLLAAYFGHWIEARETFDHLMRVPAVVLGGLAAAVVLAPGWHRVDDEVEGSVPRPSRRTELLVTLGLVAGAAVVAVLAMPLEPLERGGLEMARNLIGLSGLGLLGASVAGSRLAWVLPFAWAVASYFAVPRTYWMNPDGATIGWLMYPATYAVTWAAALVLLGLGFAAFAWGGFVPRPRRHPRR